MEKDIKVIGKFYLKNGAVIDEEIVFNKDNDMETVNKFIKKFRDSVKEGFRQDYDFQLTFGYTMFRGKDISAVTFATEEC